jgi:hypothetical protein
MAAFQMVINRRSTIDMGMGMGAEWDNLSFQFKRATKHEFNFALTEGREADGFTELLRQLAKCSGIGGALWTAS